LGLAIYIESVYNIEMGVLLDTSPLSAWAISIEEFFQKAESGNINLKKWQTLEIPYCDFSLFVVK